MSTAVSLKGRPAKGPTGTALEQVRVVLGHRLYPREGESRKRGGRKRTSEAKLAGSWKPKLHCKGKTDTGWHGTSGNIAEGQTSSTNVCVKLAGRVDGSEQVRMLRFLYTVQNSAETWELVPVHR